MTFKLDHLHIKTPEPNKTARMARSRALVAAASIRAISGSDKMV